jgi:ArsR family transcriptional regulator, arsenate/arsenite/antimonite-responsive transcriptional repressor
MATSETIILETKRQNGQSCCAPVTSRLGDQAAKAAAELFKALADPARLQILDILVQHTGLVCVCDLEGAVGLPDPQTGQRPKQPTISHHLRVLREAGLVGYEKRGVWAYYFVRRERLAEVRALVDALR